MFLIGTLAGCSFLQNLTGKNIQVENLFKMAFLERFSAGKASEYLLKS